MYRKYFIIGGSKELFLDYVFFDGPERAASDADYRSAREKLGIPRFSFNVFFNP